MKLIETEIAAGAPKYNAGDPAACVAVYKAAAEKLAAMPDEAVPADQKTKIKEALDKLGAAENDRAKAWVLRRALDAAYVAMKPAAE
jgi:hypothetical protein